MVCHPGLSSHMLLELQAWGSVVSLESVMAWEQVLLLRRASATVLALVVASVLARHP